MTDDAQKLPADHDAEASLVGCALMSRAGRDRLLAEVPAAAFNHRGYRAVVAAMEALHHRGEAINPVTVASELEATDGDTRTALLAQLAGAAVSATTARTLIGIVLDRWARRQVILAAWACSKAAFDVSEPLTVAVDAAQHAIDQGTVTTLRTEPSMDVGTFISIEDDPEDWLIPGLLERRDRVIVTGTEGSGKSVFSRCFAAQVAAGRHPFTERTMTPRRVLIIDVENHERQVRRSIRPMWLDLVRQPYPTDADRLRIEIRPQGLNLLSSAADVRWLYAMCEANRPDLLVTGPVYKLAGTSHKEEDAAAVARVFDDIRARFGCALLLEAHAPHATNPTGRDLRPYGASLWLRWPEFGFGLQWCGEGDPAAYKVAHWRGQRERRAWPTHVRQLPRPIPWGCLPHDLAREDF